MQELRIWLGFAGVEMKFLAKLSKKGSCRGFERQLKAAGQRWQQVLGLTQCLRLLYKM